MKIAILGSGIVGQTIGKKLIQNGHEVMLGSRNATNENAEKWVKESGKDAQQGTFAIAAAFGEIIFNCTKGMNSLDALKLTGAENLKGKILIDVSNPLDFTNGMPPSLTICNTDSLGEQIQRTYPETLVVKTLNTTNCFIMVNPSIVKEPHDLFISGNNPEAKKKVIDFLKKEFGWKTIIDLGDITTARGTEMLLPVWIRLYSAFGNADFNFHIARG